MDMEKFREKSGFKVLSMARLSACAYSMALYLLHCRSSGLQEIVSTEKDLADLLGYPKIDVVNALQDLSDKSMITFRCRKPTSAASPNPSISLGFQFDLSKWKLEKASQPTSQDAIVYPFVRDTRPTFSNVSPSEEEEVKPDWKQVMEAGQDLYEGSEEAQAQLEKEARWICKNHPTEQALLLLKHFRSRIPSLSLLGSSWQHYVELYESETEKIDLIEAKDRHVQIEQALRESAFCWCEREQGLSEAEREVLQVLLSHPHPRRQLFWAYKLRRQYPNLQKFFQENSDKMLAITSNGTRTKKSPV